MLHNYKVICWESLGKKIVYLLLQSQDRTFTVVVEFQVIPNSYTVKAKPKQDYDEYPIPTIPWLDVLVCNCNSSSFPRIFSSNSSLLSV